MSTTVRWSPRRELVSLREAMDRLLEESLGEQQTRGYSEARLPIDVYTTPTEIVIMASVPGLSPQEVKVVLENNTLTIRGELPSPLQDVEYIFQERPYGRFSRSLTLNVPVDNENIEATFKDGLLTLRLPKATPTEPQKIHIKVKS
jgi:HSP20 family protein